jgi:hypothetical protein
VPQRSKFKTENWWATSKALLLFTRRRTSLTLETTGPNAGEQLEGEVVSKHWRELPSNWRLGPVGRLVRAALHSMKPPVTNTRTTQLKSRKESAGPRVPTRWIPQHSKLVGRTQHIGMKRMWKAKPRVPQRSKFKTESWWAISTALNAFHSTENIPNVLDSRTYREAVGSG